MGKTTSYSRAAVPRWSSYSRAAVPRWSSVSKFALSVGLIVLAWFPRVGTASPNDLRILAASDLTFVLPDLIHAFQVKTPSAKITSTFGSSGNLFAQIQNHIPGDLFLSADQKYANELGLLNLTNDDSIFLYTDGRLALWAPLASPLNIEKLGLLAALELSAKKIAISNPRFAPYGKAALEVLQNQKLYDSVRGKLIYGDNAAQTAQFAQSDAADLAIIPVSLATSPGLRKIGRYVFIPETLHLPIHQAGVILKQTENLVLARKFRDFLLSGEGKAIFARHGFH